MPLDRASARTVARLCATLTLIGVFCVLLHALTELPVTPSPLLVVAAVAAAFALAHGERLDGPSLNRWDEAAVYLALANLVRLIVRAWSP